MRLVYREPIFVLCFIGLSQEILSVKQNLRSVYTHRQHHCFLNRLKKGSMQSYCAVYTQFQKYQRYRSKKGGIDEALIQKWKKLVSNLANLLILYLYLAGGGGGEARGNGSDLCGVPAKLNLPETRPNL